MTNLTPNFLLKYYNSISNKLKYGNRLLSIGSNVSIVNSTLGFKNSFGSNSSVLNLVSLDGLSIGIGAQIKNSRLGKNNTIGVNAQIDDSEFGDNALVYDRAYIVKSKLGSFNNIYKNACLQQVNMGSYSYIGQNPIVSRTSIGKFCSIGPNFISGWGVHPTDGVSTHPMFYSTLKHNGLSFTEKNKIEEYKPISIGSDVFIGMNVLVLDGVEIGDGAVIGAGTVVSKNIPPYAIAVGSPMQIIKYRFQLEEIEELLKIKWWDWEYEKLKQVELYFNDVKSFIAKHKM